MRPSSVFLALASTLALAAPAAARPLPAAQTNDPYFKAGQAAVARAVALTPPVRRAKNVILFLGDGMGVSTVTAARIFEGQSRGVDGPSNSLAFESLPYSAFSKTYSHDTMVTDSAAGITAITTGVKTRNGVLDLTGRAARKDCAAVASTRVLTIAEIAKQHGLSAGAITTTRLTHATPAGTYSHTPFRDWEADSDMVGDAKAAGCTDIARQLVEAPDGLRLDVAMGGGRARFLPKAMGGVRLDGRDLTRDFVQRSGPGSAYAATADELAAADRRGARHILGLFADDHLPYEADRAKSGQGVPTLSQMTSAAIDALSRNPRGYFLLVEGGRIDHGSHANQARKTVTETVEFSNAVRTALAKVDLRDTLVLVTADHSHGLVISGYPSRTSDIMGLADRDPDEPSGLDDKPSTILSFATGPGAVKSGARADPSKLDLHDPDACYPALVPLSSAAHGGEDVPVYAGGPGAELVHGVVEESYLFQVMNHALGFDSAR